MAKNFIYIIKKSMEFIRKSDPLKSLNIGAYRKIEHETDNIEESKIAVSVNNKNNIWIKSKFVKDKDKDKEKD